MHTFIIGAIGKRLVKDPDAENCIVGTVYLQRLSHFEWAYFRRLPIGWEEFVPSETYGAPVEKSA